MHLVRLHTTQRLPRPLGEVFPFFSEAANLEDITPPWLSFAIAGQDRAEMGEGQRIHYRLRFRGLPLRWTSEITRWEPPHAFVDEQRSGPYSLWHHEHRFREEAGQTVAEDVVHYMVPGGKPVDRLVVRSDVRRIFEHRHIALAQRFGGNAGEAGIRFEEFGSRELGALLNRARVPATPAYSPAAH